MAEGSIFDLPNESVVNGLRSFQGWWRELVFGEGTDWPLPGMLSGLLAFDSRLSDQPIPMADGDFVFGRWAAGRVMTIPFVITGSKDTHETRRTQWTNAFSANGPYTEEWFVFKAKESVYMVRARVVRRSIEMSPMVGRTSVANAVVELKLADPRVYDGETWLSTLFGTFGETVGGGFELATELPLDMTAPSGGVAVANNIGNVTAYPLIRVTNEGGTNLTAFTITNESHGDEVSMDAVVAPGQTVVMDFDALVRAAPGPHIHIDGSSRYGNWLHPRELFGIHPGSNTIAAEYTGGDPTLRLDWLTPTL